MTRAKRNVAPIAEDSKAADLRYVAKYAQKTDAGHELELPNGVSEEQLAATMAFSPFPRHATMMAHYAHGVVTVMGWKGSSIPAMIGELVKATDLLEKGNQRDLIDTLSAQARTLDAVFDKMLRRAEATDNLEVFESYMRFALKAQANSRATMEALSKVVRGGEQIIKHVHVGQGGQAVIADTFNHAALAQPTATTAKVAKNSNRRSKAGEHRDRGAVVKSEGQSDAA